jgi:hypothetical protein
MASLVLSGDTSGSITVSAPAVAGSTTQTLVNVTGTLAPIVSGTAQVAVTNFTTSADFTGIPSWVKRITVMLDGISLSGTDFPLFQLGDSGGLETTGYISTATRLTDSAAVSVGSNTTGFVIQSFAGATTLSGSIIFTNLTGNTWVAQGAFSNTTTTNFLYVTSGSKTLSAQLDRITLTRSGTNTFDAGTINIIYE